MVLATLRRPAPLTLLALCALAAQALPAQAQTVVAAASPSDSLAETSETLAASETALGGDLTSTRFVIGLDRDVTFRVSSLSNPNRVIVDLPSVALTLPRETSGEAVGLVSRFQAGASGPENVRVVIYVTQPVIVESAKIAKVKDGKGHRLAIEIVPATVMGEAHDAPAAKAPRKVFKVAPYGLGAVDVQPPLPRPAVHPEIRAARAFKPVIVIDPGHGGHDSGAVKNGTVEKDVVLAFSKVLKKKIEATGRFRVQLTRDKDEFVELGARVAFAERHNANLFIAVHADYAKTQARGATIYSLRESVATSLRRSAKDDAYENVLSKDEISKVSADGDIKAVRRILADLAGREFDVTKERTNLFTRSVVEYMSSSTSMRDDPDQQASFRVLKTAQFPSVLIELAYVTNKEDAKLLNSDAWREKVADSIMVAVDNYFSHQIARLPM